MQIIEEKIDFQVQKNTAVAIGKFDGIHKGHQTLLAEVVKAKEKDLLAVVFTFDPPPNVFFSGIKTKEITMKEEKREIFEKMGIDILIEFPLNKETAAITPENFIKDILANRLRAKKIIAGTDLSFGDKGEGNYELLKYFEKEYGYQAVILDKICFEGREISSTYVREEIENGRIAIANMLLGNPYSLSGIVVKGNQIGRTIDMPTVNILIEEEKLLPPNGVYISKVKWNEEEANGSKESICNGITNIGFKPTVTKKRIMGAETYLYNLSKDMYGKNITVELLQFVRKEMKFESLDKLKQQMQIDKEVGIKFFRKNGNC